jgi:hypothetical protein
MLTKAHTVLIASGAALGVIFGVYSAAHHNWPVVGAATVITAGLLLYLRWFLKK